MLKFRELELKGKEEKKLLTADDAPDEIYEEPPKSTNPRRPMWATRDKSLKVRVWIVECEM